MLSPKAPQHKGRSGGFHPQPGTGFLSPAQHKRIPGTRAAYKSVEYVAADSSFVDEGYRKVLVRSRFG